MRRDSESMPIRQRTKFDETQFGISILFYLSLILFTGIPFGIFVWTQSVVILELSGFLNPLTDYIPSIFDPIPVVLTIIGFIVFIPSCILRSLMKI